MHKKIWFIDDSSALKKRDFYYNFQYLLIIGHYLNLRKDRPLKNIIT